VSISCSKVALSTTMYICWVLTRSGHDVLLDGEPVDLSQFAVENCDFPAIVRCSFELIQSHNAWNESFILFNCCCNTGLLRAQLVSVRESQHELGPVRLGAGDRDRPTDIRRHQGRVMHESLLRGYVRYELYCTVLSMAWCFIYVLHSSI
jgi:hypothetical protein